MILGVHIRKESGGLNASIRRELPDECGAAQIFVMGPFSAKITIDDNDAARLRKMAESIEIIAHGAYVDAPWANESIELIRREIAECRRCGCSGLIVHLANHTNRSLEQILRAIVDAVPNEQLDNFVLWLEINANRPNVNTFETPAKINKLFRRIAAATHNTPLACGLCIDTAHLWACGTSTTTYRGAAQFLDQLNINAPIMFHLNDTTEPLGSGRDIHIGLCRGQIWHDYSCRTAHNSGIAAICNYAARHNSIVILERHSSDVAWDLKILRCIGAIE